MFIEQPANTSLVRLCQTRGIPWFGNVRYQSQQKTQPRVGVSPVTLTHYTHSQTCAKYNSNATSSCSLLQTELLSFVILSQRERNAICLFVLVVGNFVGGLWESSQFGNLQKYISRECVTTSTVATNLPKQVFGQLSVIDTFKYKKSEKLTGPPRHTPQAEITQVLQGEENHCLNATHTLTLCIALNKKYQNETPLDEVWCPDNLVNRCSFSYSTSFFLIFNFKCRLKSTLYIKVNTRAFI